MRSTLDLLEKLLPVAPNAVDLHNEVLGQHVGPGRMGGIPSGEEAPGSDIGDQQATPMDHAAVNAELPALCILKEDLELSPHSHSSPSARACE